MDERREGKREIGATGFQQTGIEGRDMSAVDAFNNESEDNNSSTWWCAQGQVLEFEKEKVGGNEDGSVAVLQKIFQFEFNQPVSSTSLPAFPPLFFSKF